MFDGTTVESFGDNCEEEWTRDQSNA
jgi:hypothetical protein